MPSKHKSEKADNASSNRKGSLKVGDTSGIINELTIQVDYSLDSLVEFNEIDFASAIRKNELAVCMSNDDVAELAQGFDASNARVSTLVIAASDDSKIEDEDGSVLTELMEAISELSSVTTLVFYGHDFEVLSFTAMPENVQELVFDKCKIGSIELDENDAASVETLVFANLTSGGTLTIPENAFQNVKQLKIVRCHAENVEIQDGACPVGTILEMSSCRQCETLTLGKDCFSQGEMLRVTRVPNLYRIEVGENAFENASEWNLSASLLKILVLQGNNFCKMKEVDLQFPELVEFRCGPNCMQEAKSLICQDLGKLQKLIIDEHCFERCKKLFFSDTDNLRELVFGPYTFGSLTDEDLTLSDFPRLELLEFGKSSMAKLDRFILVKCSNLRTLRIGPKALKSCEYFVLLDYVNRVHMEEDVGKLQIIPEEYPNLPQEAEIQCQANSFRVEGSDWARV
ncbi:uncharacterized protein [Blastocystis hominis]|uniref:Uncharacterized protein n=1 Tax=Blastocystis hominis TaxID=12968 RepID=D8M3W6_BLAHO|nr:uncharacterized protein [Blastocystis hominis]CBK22589.2 unnamed protein product [Blastocystis hominis]|eukprot:XP_012896637.1 uncharacterized protein [Blastocystis hominis]